MRRATIVVPSAKDFVEGQLKTLGLESRTSGFWMHKIHVSSPQRTQLFIQLDRTLDPSRLVIFHASIRLKMVVSPIFFLQLYFMELNDFFAPQLSAYLGLRLMTAIRKKIEKRKRANWNHSRIYFRKLMNTGGVCLAPILTSFFLLSPHPSLHNAIKRLMVFWLHRRYQHNPLLVFIGYAYLISLL